MTPAPERDARAGEYVLGTLSGDERAAFARELAADADLREAVRAWEERLAPLQAVVPPVEPGPQVWAGIEARLEAPAETSRRAGTVVPFGTASDGARLRRSLRLWRGAAAAAAALAAALALFILADRSGLLPRGEEYVAVVNRGGELPALVVRVDTRAGAVQVRALGAERPPQDRSLELWYIGPGGTPRSLGLVDEGSTRLTVPAAVRGAALEGGTIAVTVEPKGGSPTGKATGPVIYSGKLVREEP